MCYGGCNCKRCSGEEEEPVTKVAKQWVQHMSGVGEKWELAESFYNDNPDNKDWRVNSKKGNEYHYLPRTEYVLCDPPERWEDVTQSVGLTDLKNWLTVGTWTTARLPDGFRWKCGSDGGLHIERKVS